MLRVKIRNLICGCRVKFVLAKPKQGEYIWNGPRHKPVLCPYDSDYYHYVLREVKRNKFQKFIERLLPT